jgi:hypothetical protein
MDHVSRDRDGDIGDGTTSSGSSKTFATQDIRFENGISSPQMHRFGPSVRNFTRLSMDIVSEAEPRHGLHTPSTTHFRLFARTTVHNQLRISCLSLAFEAWTCHSGFILGHFLTSDIDY